MSESKYYKIVFNGEIGTMKTSANMRESILTGLRNKGHDITEINKFEFDRINKEGK